MAFDVELITNQLILEQKNEEVCLEFSLQDLTQEEVKLVINELERENQAYFTIDDEKKAIETLIEKLKLLQ